MAKKKTKNIFGIYTFKEIQAAEAKSYVIQLGRDLFEIGGKHIFDKAAANMYYNKILNELQNVIEGGDAEEIKDAVRALGSLRIHPLRIN